ncbi:MAG: glycoside hydrolase family 20 zincin-like fold domain-containing protein [Alistipes sp.]|nr:glycoside hydrolase family 20 zincin-like fold domain-containing protein [Alistipes sp.]
MYPGIDRELHEKEFTFDSGTDTVSVRGGSAAGVPWGVTGLRLLVTEGGEEGRCLLPCGE